MTIEEAKRRAELYLALAEGKIIQFNQDKSMNFLMLLRLA